MQECFDLAYHGGGGFTWSEVWNMPIPHRKFNLKSIQKHLDALEEVRNSQNNIVTENTDITKFQIPQHVIEASKNQKQFVSKVKSNK